MRALRWLASNWQARGSKGSYNIGVEASSSEVVVKVKVIAHKAEEGGYWAEVPSIPGCATQGETFEELLQNLYEAVEGCLSVDIAPAQVSEGDQVLEIVV